MKSLLENADLNINSWIINWGYMNGYLNELKWIRFEKVYQMNLILNFIFKMFYSFIFHLFCFCFFIIGFQICKWLLFQLFHWIITFISLFYYHINYVFGLPIILYLLSQINFLISKLINLMPLGLILFQN